MVAPGSISIVVMRPRLAEPSEAAQGAAGVAGLLPRGAPGAAGAAAPKKPSAKQNKLSSSGDKRSSCLTS